MRIRSFVFLTTTFTFSQFGNLFAQPQVASVAPRQNEINVPLTSAIGATFSEDINAATLNAVTFLMYGNQTGFYSGFLSYDAPTRTARFQPDRFFKDGEIVSVTLTSGILNNAGQALPPFQWSFTVAVEIGTGIFDERIEVSVGENELVPADLFAGDLNNDQFSDLAVVNSGTNSVTILINRFVVPGGSFDPPVIVPVGNGPTSISGGDFDKDGLIDLAVSNFDDNTITVLRNAGAVSFPLAQTIATAEHPTQIEARDFNSDGHLDLAAVILGLNRLQIFLNDGIGNFIVAPEMYNTGASPYALTTADFDNDGDIDIVVSNSGDNTILVFDNNGSAQFTQSGEITVPDFPTMIRANDLIGRNPNNYGDTFVDIAIAHPNINSISILENRSLDGGFVLFTEIPVGVQPTNLVLADVDTFDVLARTAGLGKDHDLDIAVANLLSQDVHLLRNQFNNGFTEENEVYAAGETPTGITSADLDRDGDIDLAVTNLTTQTVTVLLNRGGRTGSIRFTEPTLTLDFGQVYVGTDSTQRLNIINPTNENIFLNNVSATLPVFTTSATQAVIAPGQIFALDVTFTPADTVVYEDSLMIQSMVLGLPSEVKIGLRGEGIIAIISVIPDTLAFGNVQPPQTRTLPIQIINSGNGALLVSALEFTDPAFTAPVNQLIVPPHSRQQVDITFTPALPIAYVDTLTVVNNDSANPRPQVILLGGANLFPPVITSADTVTAIEDIFFSYSATATDADGTQSLFVFRNLPHWLSSFSMLPTNNSVQGTPREGDRDTSFVVIARDGFFSDTLAVFVRVIPVNDPPVFDPIAVQTATELALVTFQISATDPEDSTLTFSSLNLPPGATLTDTGRLPAQAGNTANFSWVPPFGSRGAHDITFVVREVFEQVPLSDTTVVRIVVGPALSDLIVQSLGIDNTDIALNQTRVITGVARANAAPVAQPFHLTFLHDGVVAKDTVIAGLGLDAEFAFTYTPTFTRLGAHEIVFFVDMGNQVPELDEDNNSAILRLQVSKGALAVRPNPFTPNDDGFNDLAVFDFGELTLLQPQLKILKFNGSPLMTLEQPRNSRFEWNGRDESGRDQQPGIYLYILSDGNNRVASGYVVLAR